MLRLTGISKSYTSGTFTQRALDGVSLDFRQNEFVTVLGPSGCGKTTLLNIIGGLDHYDEGDLVISGKSTKDFVDEDWDMYRNNSIGFIFQSHNLIPHLSVLQNVELGLALSGETASERKRRATELLTEVGLADHIHKRPNQLSGGQSQRVAIARALANNPDVVLADEPTGSLDSVTSVQILDLIKKIAEDKLVIMVTHNSELAYKYSSRIIKLKDGKVVDDSNPVVEAKELKQTFSLKKTAMTFKTAVVSSLNNIRTKLGRTLLTAFAGSIGIIGIALILSLSNGLDQEISAFEQETLAGYPISITDSRVDFEKMRQMDVEDMEAYPETQYATVYDENRLASFFLPNTITDDYVNYVTDYVANVDPEGISGLKLVKNVNMSLLRYNEELLTYVPIYTEDLESAPQSPASALGFVSKSFTLLPEGDVFDSNYDVIFGDYPTNNPAEQKFQVLLVVDEYNRIYKSTLENRLGFDTTTQTEFQFSDIVGKTFKLYVGEYELGVSDASTGLDIEISGIARIKQGSSVSLFYNGFGYDSGLIDYIEDNYPDEVGRVNSIYIYPVDFDQKEELKTYLDAYNDQFDPESTSRIEYVDQAATFTNMVKGVIDTISIVLIAFAAISLVVSSIMIAIITYISVLERIKEIGVLRALGARKKDVARVFNTENLLIGFGSGLVGVFISLLLLIPINLIIENLAEMPNVGKLSSLHAFFLVGVSIVLAFISGLVPARMASKKDPVVALRTE
ncbi:MAG: ATP-binding cassette domain-containing protein [Bacilli bacterium]|nr:ATP-binding cassette domain-containing protein [Bacilli bacterium]MBN2696329.1 ATP-binding cassette domain-containing protein [Bacilli bacterium]